MVLIIDVIVLSINLLFNGVQYFGSNIPLDILFDGHNFTCDPNFMWSTEHHFGCPDNVNQQIPSSLDASLQSSETSHSHSSSETTVDSSNNKKNSNSRIADAKNEQVITITIDFHTSINISMIRMWNFNASRVSAISQV